MTKEQYKMYLRSSHWEEIKNNYYKSKSFKNRCYCCGKHSRIYHLHHKTYKRLGYELLTDVAAVCSKCNTMINQIVNVRKLKRQLKKEEKIKNILKESYTEEKKLGIKDI